MSRSHKTISGLISIMIVAAMLLYSCQPCDKDAKKKNLPDQFVVVLGITQDAGYPQAGCEKECCKAFYEGKETKKLITCLALVDRKANQYWLFEATPDIGQQLKNLQPYLLNSPDYTPDGIFLTHAHIGHYAGLMQLGREAMGTKDIPVWAMPRMDSFLRNNGPWSQLVSLKNIQLQPLHNDSAVALNNNLTITPIRVPHRDEYSETVGYLIQSNRKKLLFIPDIDKWEKWDRSIEEEIKKVDIALLDATFYANGELPGRDMKEIPHPFAEESMQRFSSLPSAEKSKIIFIHFNHTNPLLKIKSAEKDSVRKAGFGTAEEGMVIGFD